MRIGFDAKRIFYNQTGLGNYARSLITGLCKEFPENTYDLYSPGIRICSDFMKGQSQVNRHLPAGFISKTFPKLWRNQLMLHELVKDNIEVYHGLSNELPKGIEHTRIKTVVTIHDLIFMHYPQNYPWFDRQIYQRKFRSAVTRAHVVIATSEQTKRDLMQYYGTNENKIEVIYQDCDEAFRTRYTAEEKLAVVQKYQLPKQFILSVGTLEKRKNHLTLLKAFKEANLPGIQIVLIGKKADAYDEINSFIQTNKLGDKVKLIDHVSFSDLPLIYQSAHVFSYPSLFEGFGIPVLEALRSGVPTVTSNTSSLPEVAGNAAILVDPSSVNELKIALETACFDNEQRTRLLANAANQVEKFDANILSSQLMKVYKNLLST